jgi:hypothetical protein
LDEGKWRSYYHLFVDGSSKTGIEA